jgi:hypothetical protein
LDTFTGEVRSERLAPTTPGGGGWVLSLPGPVAMAWS